MEECIFCKLANGSIPSKTIYEDEEFRVILDLAPATKGHALIIPKVHVVDLFDISEQVAGKAMVLARKLAHIMKDKLQCDGFNLVQNNGTCAGQTVFHFHLHLIPRYREDGQRILWEPQDYSQEELENIRLQIIQ